MQLEHSLAGKKIMLTRPVQQSAAWAAQLSTLGAVPIIFPLIEIKPSEKTEFHRNILIELGIFDYLLFTSTNGVKYFLDMLKSQKIPVSSLSNLTIGAVGEVTADHLSIYGLKAALVPPRFAANELAAIIPEPQGKYILIPSGNMTRDDLAKTLTAQGADVVQLPVYDTVRRTNGNHELWRLMLEGLDVITFASPSAVDAYMDLRPVGFEDPIVACIGPVTARRAQELGLQVTIMPEKFTVEALTEAIEKYYIHDVQTEEAENN